MGVFEGCQLQKAIAALYAKGPAELTAWIRKNIGSVTYTKEEVSIDFKLLNLTAKKSCSRKPHK